MNRRRMFICNNHRCTLKKITMVVIRNWHCKSVIIGATIFYSWDFYNHMVKSTIIILYYIFLVDIAMKSSCPLNCSFTPFLWLIINKLCDSYYIKFSQKLILDQNFMVFLHLYIVSAPATSKTFAYRISFKSIYFYYFAPPYWIRCFEFLSTNSNL